MVGYDEYSRLGFCAVSEEDYGRFSALAQAAVLRLTGGRAGRESLSDYERMAFCEIVDIFFSEHDRSARLESFSNDGYSERYSIGEASPLERAETIVGLCFGKELACRGVKGVSAS